MLFDIFQNSDLNARGFLAPARSTVHQNEFGANLGGPVFVPRVYDGRNKTFFFFGYVGSRKTGNDQVQRLRLPTPAERAGDFSGAGRVIYDPATTSIAGTTYVRAPFPGGIIPANRFDPVAVNVIKLLPGLNLSNAGALNYQNYIGEFLLNPDVFVVRIDQSFGSNHRLYGSYTHTHIPRNNVTAALADPFSDKTNQNITSHMVHGGYDWVISPNLLNSVQIGFNKFANPFSGFFANQGYAAKFGLKGIVGDSFPDFTFGDGYAPLGRSDNGNSLEQSLIIKDMLSWTRGRQTIKSGVEYRMFYAPSHDASNSAGTYSFSDLATALPTSINTTGDSYASFLLGQVSSASMSYPFSSVSHKAYWSGFIQEDIRVTPKLTLNLGLRYEVVLAPYEVNNQYSIVDLATPNPGAGGLPGASIFAGSGPGRSGSSTLLNTRYDGIGPRFGFAWQIDSKTALRGGYGIFYGDNGVFASTTGFRTVVGLQTLDQGITPPFILSQGFPATSAQVQLTPGLLNGQSVTAGRRHCGVPTADTELVRLHSACTQGRLGAGTELRRQSQHAAERVEHGEHQPGRSALPGSWQPADAERDFRSRRIRGHPGAIPWFHGNRGAGPTSVSAISDRHRTVRQSGDQRLQRLHRAHSQALFRRRHPGRPFHLVQEPGQCGFFGAE